MRDLPQPQPTPSPERPGRAVPSAVIVLDAGHGGDPALGGDPGAVAIDGTKESDLALAVVNALFLELTLRGHKVYRTREKDAGVALGDRAKIANALPADCFVSVHFNASLNVMAKGAWILHAAGSVRGKALARSIYRALNPEPDAPEKVYPDASPHTGKRRLAVLRQTKMPAVLVECGFLTNPADLEQIKRPGWTEKTAERIADGIEKWLSSKAVA